MDKRVQVLKLTARENRTGIATESDVVIDLSELSFVSKSGTFFCMPLAAVEVSVVYACLWQRTMLRFVAVSDCFPFFVCFC